MDDEKKLEEALHKIGAKPRKIKLRPLSDDFLDRIKVTCPVCQKENVIPDIGAHGPGISIMVYDCGCSVRSEIDKPTKLIRYDGEIFIDDE